MLNFHDALHPTHIPTWVVHNDTPRLPNVPMPMPLPCDPHRRWMPRHHGVEQAASHTRHRCLEKIPRDKWKPRTKSFGRFFFGGTNGDIDDLLGFFGAENGGIHDLFGVGWQKWCENDGKMMVGWWMIVKWRLVNMDKHMCTLNMKLLNQEKVSRIRIVFKGLKGPSMSKSFLDLFGEYMYAIDWMGSPRKWCNGKSVAANDANHLQVTIGRCNWKLFRSVQVAGVQVAQKEWMESSSRLIHTKQVACVLFFFGIWNTHWCTIKNKRSIQLVTT